ncbi:hypothetical protein [Daejeonella sp. H1SJ63]|nr:hypothetical protein [Daejeonella sp. H1SJ63]
MEQRISVLTIGADDLQAMKNFYSGIPGWTPLTETQGVMQLTISLLRTCD